MDVGAFRDGRLVLQATMFFTNSLKSIDARLYAMSLFADLFHSVTISLLISDAAKHFRSIYKTQGNDLLHLMVAMR